ncbi:MAG: hypothetical protein JSV05_07495 [Candidatus Bathyarchaeota archaeon]|nr:MAG: hypothetical protein JSV05_07495 [Candidatus Bathyarchaeota archaeon]
MKSQQKLLVFSLILILGVAASSLIRPVLADVPTIENIEPWISGTDTILNITIRHASPTGTHYVDRIEVDINGSIEFTTLFPQATVTFIVPYNIGEVIGTPLVSVRAHCTFHGWSGWSEPLLIPEFTVFLLLALAVLPMIAYLLRSKTHRALKNGS